MNWECRLIQLVAVLLCVSLPLCRAGLERVCSHDQSQYQNKHLCGRQLADMIQMLCSQFGKRSGDAPVKAISREVAMPLAAQRSPFMDKAQALAYLYKRSYNTVDYRTGVVCECCYHQCYAMELMQYCSSDKRAFPPAQPQKRFQIGIVTTNPQPSNRHQDARIGQKTHQPVDVTYMASALEGQRMFDKDSFRSSEHLTNGNKQKLSRDDLSHQDDADEPAILFSKENY